MAVADVIKMIKDDEVKFVDLRSTSTAIFSPDKAKQQFDLSEITLLRQFLDRRAARPPKCCNCKLGRLC